MGYRGRELPSRHTSAGVLLIHCDLTDRLSPRSTRCTQSCGARCLARHPGSCPGIYYRMNDCRSTYSHSPARHVLRAVSSAARPAGRATRAQHIGRQLQSQLRPQHPHHRPSPGVFGTLFVIGITYSIPSLETCLASSSEAFLFEVGYSGTHTQLPARTSQLRGASNRWPTGASRSGV